MNTSTSGQSTTFKSFGLDVVEIDDLLDGAEAGAESPDASDEAPEFVDKMRKRFAQYGVEAFCSLKQLNWLRELAGEADE